MRLLVADCDPDHVKSALATAPVKGCTVSLNPHFLDVNPQEEDLWIACGAPAVKMVQAAGWITKAGGVVAHRGKLFTVMPEDQGWSKPINLGITYAPQIKHMDYADYVNFITDIQLYRRFEQTGSMEPKLGHYAYVKDLKGVIEYIDKKHAQTGQAVVTALDLETMGLFPWYPDKNILVVQVSAGIGLSDVVYVPDLSKQELDELIADLHWLCTSSKVKIIGANLKFDMSWLRAKWGIVVRNFVFDTCNGGSLVEENRPNSLNIHTKIYAPELGGYDDPFNRKFDKDKMETVPKEDMLPYAGGDTDAVLRIFPKIRAELMADNNTITGKPAKNSLASLYTHVVSPALVAIHKMEYHGVCVDTEKFHEFGADLQGRMVEDCKAAVDLLPKHLIDKYGGLVEGGAPLSKANMIAEHLFTPHGLNIKPLVKTEKAEKPSTSEHHLSQFKDHPEAGPLIERYISYKQVSKMYGTYYEGFLAKLRPDNRWHASYIIHKQGKDKYNQQDAAGTVTGRGSAVDPAFQCVAGDTEIATDQGIRLAADIIDGSGVSDTDPMVPGEVTLWTRMGWRKSTYFFRSWRADLLKVTLHCGSALTCTPEHPILTHRGWVQAQHLDPEDFLRPVRPVPKRDAGSAWNEYNARVWGIIDTVGSHTAGFIEVPEEFRDVVQTALDLGEPEDFEGHTVFRSHFLKYDRFAELRGTRMVYPYLRGVFEAAGSTSGGKGTSKVTIPNLEWSRAVAIQREAMTSGIHSPWIIPTTGGKFRLEFRGRSAREFLRRCGLSVPDHWKGPPAKFENEPFSGYQIKHIHPAPAGYVYDFTVPETHSFTANGWMVHNTVPKHSYWGKRIRECIIAPPGYRIAGLDYSQGELKITACWANERNMIDAYTRGIDLHTLTAATVNGMSYEEAINLKKVSPDAYKDLRQRGKAGNFGLIYGISPYGFVHYADQSYGVQMTLEEAEIFHSTFFSLYPGLPLWHDRQIAEAQQNGFVRSPFGRTRRLHNIFSPVDKTRKESERQAINSPIQGTLGDVMWWSMGIIEQRYEDEIIPFGNVHDQGLWYVPEDTWQEDTRKIKEVMENLPMKEAFGWEPELAFTTDAEIGSNLAELVEVAL